jgi:hypothetical protein
MQAVRASFGGDIDLDPASCAEANERVRAKQYFTKDMDGLKQDWTGSVFLNPPGDSRGKGVKLFWKKAVYHACKGEASVIWVGFNLNQLVTLQECVDSPLAFPTCILNRRIAFVPSKELEAELRKKAAERGKEYSNSPAHGNYISIVSKNPQHIEGFCAEFSKLGTIVQKR